MVITIVRSCLFGAAIYYFKTKYGLSWTFWTRKEKDIRDKVFSEIDLDSGSSSVA